MFTTGYLLPSRRPDGERQTPRRHPARGGARVGRSLATIAVAAVLTGATSLGFTMSAAAAPADVPVPSGSVIAWGNNSSGQTAVPTSAESGVSAVAAGDGFSLALKSNGSVIGWGNPRFGGSAVPAAAQSGVTAIATRQHVSLALKDNGSVVAWGLDDQGQGLLTPPAAAASGVVAISAGEWFAVALKADGSVISWGANDLGQAEVPSQARSGVQAISAGATHTVALKTDGTLVAWGSLNGAPAWVPMSGTYTAISAGVGHDMAIRSDGRTVTWGGSAVPDLLTPPAEAMNPLGIAAGPVNNYVVTRLGQCSPGATTPSGRRPSRITSTVGWRACRAGTTTRWP